MHQGQVGWLETRKDAKEYESISLWVVKLRVSKNSVTFLSVGGGKTIEPNLVDDSMENKHPDRPYMITLVVSPEEQAKAMNVRSDLLDTIKIRAIEESLDCKISELEEARDYNNRIIEKCSQEIAELSAKNSKISELMTELKSAVAGCWAGKPPMFYYAYAKHTPEGAEFCWRIPSRLVSSVHPGSEVLAETAYGDKTCTVTRIQEMPYYLSKHKLIIGVVK